MREKLIELIGHVQYLGGLELALADHLIANGVTIPVRCKDCKHWADGVNGCTEHVKCCKIGFYMVGENGYCVYGERRTECE
jgi:hypothetical protein